MPSMQPTGNSSRPTTTTSGGKQPLPPSSSSSRSELQVANYSCLRRLRKTLYGETLLCQDNTPSSSVRSEQQKLVVLKRINLAELKENTVGGQENPLEERHVMQVLHRNGGHRNIVRYNEPKGMFIERGNLYIAMEFCEDGDLFDFIDAQPNGCVSQRDALHLLFQISSGLAFLHDNGIAHRDLSLENVLLHRGTAKLCDFGLSCDATKRQNESVGKLSYMAPEVAAASSSGAFYDPKAADMWSLGVILFVLLTGSPLIAEEALRENMMRVLIKFGVSKVLELWQMKDRADSGTLALLESLLQASPARRPSAAQVLRNPVFWNINIPVDNQR